VNCEAGFVQVQDDLELIATCIDRYFSKSGKGG